MAEQEAPSSGTVRPVPPPPNNNSNRNGNMPQQTTATATAIPIPVHLAPSVAAAAAAHAAAAHAAAVEAGVIPGAASGPINIPIHVPASDNNQNASGNVGGPVPVPVPGHVNVPPGGRVHQIHIRAPQGGSLRVNVGGRMLTINHPGGGPGPGGPHGHVLRTPPPARLPPLLPRPLPDAQQDMRTQNQSQSRNPSNQQQSSPTEGSDDNVNNDLDAFKCAICLEYMRDPSGCGNCSARFCYSCLARVANSNANGTINIGGNNMPIPIPNGSSTNGGGGSKCPICRASLRLEDIQRDKELQQRIHSAPRILCRYQQCAQLIPLDQVAAHEVHCPCVKVHCRYKTFGCEWVGPRSALNHHESAHCALARVSSLVQRHRQLQADVAQRLDIFGQNMAANGVMLEAQRLRQVHVNSPSNPLQLVQFVVLVMCTTPQFLLTKDAWTNLHATAQARAAVFNFVVMLPTNVLIFQIIAKSYQELLSYNHDYIYDLDNTTNIALDVENSSISNSSSISSSSSSDEVPESFSDFVDVLLTFLNMSCLAFIIIVCFFVDGKSSVRWEFFRFPGPMSQPESAQRILLHTVAMALLAAHALTMHFSQSALRAVLVWAFVCVASTVFPAIVSTILEAANGINVPGNATPMQASAKIINAGRAARPLLFGLRYGPIAATFGLGPCIDAALIVFLARTYIAQHWSTTAATTATATPQTQVDAAPSTQSLRLASWVNLISLDNELFLSGTPANRIYTVVAIRVASIAVEMAFDDQLVIELVVLDSTVAVVLLLMTNFALIQFAWAGIQIGARIASASRMELLTTINTNGIPTLRKDYNGVGMASFCVWTLCLMAIALTY